MAGNGRGGARPGAGRKGNRLTGTFRTWCRGVIDNPDVRARIEAEAKVNPEFALKVGEHGYGRPPQSLTLKGDEDRPLQVEYRAAFSDGAAFGLESDSSGSDTVSAAVAPIPGGGGPVEGAG